jgi:ribosomal protein L37AE/L43A
MFGEQVGLPPCGAMMKPTRVYERIILWDCTGCAFAIAGPAERELKRIKRLGLKVVWKMGIRDGNCVRSGVQLVEGLFT